MKKPVFYQAVLEPVKNIMEHVYPELHGTKDEMTLDERLGDAECPDCPKQIWVKKTHTRWMLLAKETIAVAQGGKAYIECLDCGYVTHL